MERFTQKDIADDPTLFREGLISYIDRTPADTAPFCNAIRPVYTNTDQGAIFQHLRKRERLTLRRMARLLGLSARDLSSLETGRIVFKGARELTHYIDVFLQLLEIGSDHVTKSEYEELKENEPLGSIHPCTHWRAPLCDCKGACSCHFR